MFKINTRTVQNKHTGEIFNRILPSKDRTEKKFG